jgi:hypothetical protein
MGSAAGGLIICPLPAIVLHHASIWSAIRKRQKACGEGIGGRASAGQRIRIGLGEGLKQFLHKNLKLLQMKIYEL